MPWPLIAGLVAKVLGGALGSGALGGLAGGAGSAAGATGATGAAAGGIGGAGGMLGKAGNIMGMMGGGGGQQQAGQSGGGMMGGIMNIAKTPLNNMNQNSDEIVGMLKAQDGATISPELIDYLSKLNGQGQTTGQVSAQPQININPPNPSSGVTSANEGMIPVENPPINTPAQTMGQPMPGAAPTPTIQNPNAGMAPELQSAVTTPTNPTGAKSNDAQGGSMTNPMGSILSTMSSNKGQYQTDQRGITQVTETSNIAGDALSKAKKGNLLGAGLAVVSGTINQASQMRRQAREEEQWGSEMERAMKRSSAYNDPNSVYYAAKDGASIDPSLPPLWHQNNNLSSMMGSGPGYKKGGMLKMKC